MVGSTLDHYRIESTLGTGGMGIVYRARDLHLDRLVAIKVLPADKTADPARKQRFIQEAKAASALNHPNIVTIHDIRAHNGVDFIVMEYVAGHTLAELIPSKGMRTSQALTYAVQMADALSKAHSAGIVHRDLKPANVMVTEEGRVKVLDFGLAKLVEPTPPSSEGTTIAEPPLTQEGALVGTPAYMSPEQAEGRTVDARSDIFSFGAILYEMGTGRKPFTGESWVSILSKILNEDATPPGQLAAAIPAELDKAILRCLRKDPARRYQTMADLKVALEDLQQSGSSKQATHAPSRRRRAWAALLPVLLVAGFFGWRVSRSPATMDPLRAVPLTTLPGIERYPSLSSDGNHVAFTWTGEKQDNPDIYVQQIGAGSPLRLTTDPSNDYNPVWSPDGRWIAFLRSRSEAGRSELRLIPPLGGPERKLAEVHVRGGTFINPPYLAWCPDGRCLVVTDSPGEGKADALFVISAETGEKRALTNPQPPATGDTNPAISPDGNWLVFRRHVGGLYAAELHRLALGNGVTAAGEPQRLTAALLDAGYPAWLSDSRTILFSMSRRSLWKLDVPGATTPVRLPFVGEDGLMPVVSRPQPGLPSRLVYVRSFDDYNIWRVDTSSPGATASSVPTAFISSTRGEWFPQFSPDGHRVAFASDRSGEGGIWLANADGSNVVSLAPMGAYATGGVRWSPDGERVVFHSNREGQPDVWMIPAAGGKLQNLGSPLSNDAFPSFSHNGRSLYFSSNRTGRFQIWKMPASGGDAVQVTKDGGWVPLESPDGAFVYYVQTMDAPSPLWRIPTSGGAPVKVLDGVVLGNYAVRERGIYYIDRPTGQGGVYYLDKPSGETRLQYFSFATRRSTTIAGNLGVVDVFLTVSPDGRTILYSRMDSSVDDLMLVENFR